MRGEPGEIAKRDAFVPAYRHRARYVLIQRNDFSGEAGFVQRGADMDGIAEARAVRQAADGHGGAVCGGHGAGATTHRRRGAGEGLKIGRLHCHGGKIRKIDRAYFF